MHGLIIDNFAGGGGASQGIEEALGRPVDFAINHSATALKMHAANHPHTHHVEADVFDVKPRELTGGAPVGLAWFSPDCKHFSRAKGGKPVDKQIRGLAWVAVRWAQDVRPAVIVLENVREFETWGPLVGDRPDPARIGLTFRRFVGRLRGLGYQVEWRELNAADYGAPTHRRRLFLIARCDGRAIVWPEPTHGDPKKLHQSGLFGTPRRPWRTAAECIDWSIPCPSIFDRKRPLAEKTLRRIAMGLKRFVLDNPQPFVVRICQNGSDSGKVHSVEAPLGTIVSKNEHCLVTPYVTRYNSEKSPGDVRGQVIDEPASTLDTQNRLGLVTSTLVHVNHGGERRAPGAPVGTITAKNDRALAAAYLVRNNHGEKPADSPDEPLRTVTSQGNRFSLVRAFLIKYFGCGTGQAVTDPLHTVTSRDRFGLVTIEGADYAIADIGLRMLTPRELARAQGFPDSYVLPKSKTRAVAAIGNSVSPPVARAIVAANCGAGEGVQVA